MKITKTQLKQIIKEELNGAMQTDAESDQEKYETAIRKIQDLVEEAESLARRLGDEPDFVDFIGSLHDAYGSGAI